MHRHEHILYVCQEHVLVHVLVHVCMDGLMLSYVHARAYIHITHTYLHADLVHQHALAFGERVSERE